MRAIASNRNNVAGVVVSEYRNRQQQGSLSDHWLLVQGQVYAAPYSCDYAFSRRLVRRLDPPEQSYGVQWQTTKNFSGYQSAALLLLTNKSEYRDKPTAPCRYTKSWLRTNNPELIPNFRSSHTVNPEGQGDYLNNSTDPNMFTVHLEGLSNLG